MSLLNKDTIFFNNNFSNQDEVFRFISDKSKEFSISENSENVLEDLINRENQGTTGMMDGFAIPHASNSSIKEPSVFIIKNNNGIEWNSMDDKPIDFIICLLIPSEEKSTTHLEVLKNISRSLMHKDVRDKLHNANSKEEIIDILDLES